jgi:hypothetical protein
MIEMKCAVNFLENKYVVIFRKETAQLFSGCLSFTPDYLVRCDGMPLKKLFRPFDMFQFFPAQDFIQDRSDFSIAIHNDDPARRSLLGFSERSHRHAKRSDTN